MYKAIYTHPQNVHKEYKKNPESTELGSELYLIIQMFGKKKFIQFMINKSKNE